LRLTPTANWITRPISLLSQVFLSFLATMPWPLRRSKE